MTFQRHRESAGENEEALWLGSSNGDVKVVRRLLEEFQDPNVSDEQGESLGWKMGGVGWFICGVLCMILDGVYRKGAFFNGKGFRKWLTGRTPNETCCKM